jgi:hypothetical protein
MGLGLAATTGSLIVVAASILAGIVWWLGTQSESLSQTESPNNFIAGLHPMWREAVFGLGTFLFSLLIFSIRSL